MYIPSSIRSSWLAALTDCPPSFHSGSTLTAGKNPFGVSPEQPEPVPLAVVRHMRQQPPMTVRQIVVIVERRGQPVGRALEHQHLALHARR